MQGLACTRCSKTAAPSNRTRTNIEPIVCLLCRHNCSSLAEFSQHPGWPTLPLLSSEETDSTWLRDSLSHTTRSWQSLTHFVQVVSAPFSPGLKCAVPADVSVCSLWSVPLYQCVSGFRLDQNQVIRLVNSCRAKAPSETSNFCHSTSLILRKLPEVLVQGRGSLAFLLESDSGTMEWNLKSDFFFFHPSNWEFFG